VAAGPTAARGDAEPERIAVELVTTTQSLKFALGANGVDTKIEQ
jgi:hypothetical protein